MKEQSNFLPRSMAGALKKLGVRVVGLVLLGVGLWLIMALVWHNPYLDGWGTASTFGAQTLMGQIAGMVRYLVGFVPAMFMFLCLARRGIMVAMNWPDDAAPEYNFLRGVVAVCVGAAGFGLMVPGATYGGLLGAVASADLSDMLGVWGILIGVLFVAAFVVLGAVLLHIKWSHIQKAARTAYRGTRIVLSAFHLTRGAVSGGKDENAGETVEENDTEEIEEVDAEENTESEKTPQHAPVKRRARVSATGVIKKPVGASAVEYELPSPKFLERSNFGKNVVTPELKRNAIAMEARFADYGVHGKVVGIRPGPIVTLYEFLPENGVRMNDVVGTVKDMTRAMATENMRIAHIPGTQYIGVEMVNLNRQMVRFQSLVDNPTFTESKYKIPLALGVDIGGNPMYYDLAKMPHMLIAGRTGSGKSVFVQSIITSIVYHFTPDKCKLMIIDPKGVDFTMWDDIPHLITPIIKMDAVAAVTGLKWSVGEMENRYKRLQSMGAQNIENYNAIVSQKRATGEIMTRQVAVGTDEETGELLFETQEVDLSDMPYLVIIIDEVADLMSVARKDVEASVQRLAQKARAAGIHLVMATQRPDAQTITGVIKANFPTRISFQARSAIDSRTTLGEGGAENLLSCGDMLFSEAGRVPVRIHGAFIHDSELIRVADFLRTQGEPEYTPGITDAGDNSVGDFGAMSSGGAAASAKGDKDADLYTQAKECVLRDKKPTISYIQRRLQIGYNKAATFMERMEQEGIVSAPDANNKRQIL